MDERLAIYELQDALEQILTSRGFPGVVYPDGIFGPETTEAVRMFQKMEGLPQTGEVDRTLWDLIQTRLTELIEQGRIQPLPVFPNDSFVLQPGGKRTACRVDSGDTDADRRTVRQCSEAVAQL